MVRDTESHIKGCGTKVSCFSLLRFSGASNCVAVMFNTHQNCWIISFEIKEMEFYSVFFAKDKDVKFCSKMLLKTLFKIK